MDRIKAILSRPTAYSRLQQEVDSQDGGESVRRPVAPKPEFSRGDYTVFVLLGIAMLWAWNMFLVASPYFEERFAGDEWIKAHFQSAIISVATVTNLGSMLLLTNLQSGITYPSRISWSCIINILTFSLLAVSTKAFTGASAGGYLVFLLCMVFLSSLATGLSQNGVFAYVSGIGNQNYTHGVMTGQAVAGILPPLAQIMTVLSAPADTVTDLKGRSTAAMNYFIIATLISALAMVAFGWHLRSNEYRTPVNADPASLTLPSTSKPPEEEPKRHVPIIPLLIKMRWLVGAVFICFAVTMLYAVYTASIHSIHESIDTSHTSSKLNSFAVFVPLAFFFWNLGDLLGRLMTALPNCNLSARPRFLFWFSLIRVVWVPMYYLCNIRNRGATVQSDVFYLVIIQFLFGLSNGWLGSNCMMGASSVQGLEEDAKEAAGGAMSMCLVAGLTAGSFLSFLVQT